MTTRTSIAAQLVEKLSVAFKSRNPLTLSIEDIELIVAAGTLVALSNAEFGELETQARQRIAARSLGRPPALKAKGSAVPRMDDDQPFSVRSLAEHWAVSESTIRKLVHSGELDHFKFGGQLIRIPAKAVAEFETRRSE